MAENGNRRDRRERSRREWKVRARENEQTGEFAVDRTEVRALLLDIEALGHLAGGSFVLAPVRVRHPDGEHEVWGWIATWETAPAISPQQAEKLLFGEPAPPPEPEPVLEMPEVADLGEDPEELDVLETTPG